MKIIFMGTPQFAVPSLKKIISESEHQILAVFSSAAKPRGRGQKLQDSEVACLAKEYDIPVHTPLTIKKNSEVIAQIKQYCPDIIVVVAYGYIIPQEILDIPQHGCINLHPSALPKYRGAAPMQRTIENGEKTSSVCVIKMTNKMDAGDILISSKVSISADIKIDEYANYCSVLGAELILNCLNNFFEITPESQNHNKVTFANKITKEEGKVNWHEPATKIYNRFRAFHMWPGTESIFKNSSFKIVDCQLESSAALSDSAQKVFAAAQPGEILCLTPLMVKCGDDAKLLTIKKLKFVGKKTISAAEFICGYKPVVGETFSE